MSSTSSTSSSSELEHSRRQIAIMRRELKNLRTQVVGLRAELKKETSRLHAKLDQAGGSHSAQEKVVTCAGDDGFVTAPIGHLWSDFYHSKNGTPRQPGICRAATARITIESSGSGINWSHALEGLESFSHVWIIWQFHLHQGVFTKAKVAPPRLGGLRVGVFSTRSPHRPNSIGLTLAKVDRVEGDTLFVSGHDLVNGTPILDIKPYIPAYDKPSSASTESEERHEANKCHGEVLVPAWVDTRASDLQVTFTSRALRDLETFPHALKSSIIEILTSDPRSVYRKDKCSDRLYFLAVGPASCTVWFDQNLAEVLRVKPISESPES